MFSVICHVCHVGVEKEGWESHAIGMLCGEKYIYYYIMYSTIYYAKKWHMYNAIIALIVSYYSLFLFIPSLLGVLRQMGRAH